MKKILSAKSLIFIFFATIFVSSCDKEISEPVVPAYSPANQDLNAGTWKTYILKTPDEVVIAEPAATNSATYTAELSTMNAGIGSLTTEQKKAVEYWGAGAVYRWNEIARELAARYNIPPPSKADGTYGVPDRTKPLEEPKFPFANPPYTARALAYLSVAQYDALVSTRFYQNKFGRKVDATTNTAYPSDAVVVAAASYAVLVNMFPGEVPFLDSKLKNAKDAAGWAGKAVPSDIAASEPFGKAIAAKTLARGATDGMGAANNQALTAGLIAAAKERGIKETWVSQETPKRPPMLPNYGAVATWNFDKATLAQIRPAIPYIVGSTEWQKDFDELSKINKSQTREQARIANYWADGAGSYTPPGHWHRTAANAGVAAKFSEVRMARTLALLGTAEMDAGIACWETKFYYYTPRPQQFGLKTSVGLPNFPSYTSGHSTFSAAAATVLGAVFPDKATEFENQAKEASNSRIFGLIHYRVDCEMGLAHGKKIGEFAVARGKADGSGL